MKVGDRVKLIFTDDPYTELKYGDTGIITGISKEQISVDWDNGSNLMMLPDKDIIKVLA